MRQPFTAKALRAIRTQGAAVGVITAVIAAVTVAAYLHIGAKRETLTLPDLLLIPPVQSEPQPNGSDQLRTAQAAMHSGDYAAAEQAYLEARAMLSPDSEADILSAAEIDRRLAEICFLTDRRADADILLDRAVGGFAAAPDSAALAKGQKALYALLSGEEESGLSALKSALTDLAATAKSPADRLDACSMLADGYLAAGQPADAVKYANLLAAAAQTADPDSLPEYQSRLAEALLQNREYPEAERIAREALANTDSESIRLSLNRTLSLACAHQQHAQDAESALAELEGHADPVDLLRLKAECALLCGDTKSALTAANAALEAAPESAHADIAFWRGGICESAGNYFAAKEVYTRAGTLRTEHAAVTASEIDRALCRVCTALHLDDEAVTYGQLALAGCDRSSREAIPVLADLALACILNYEPENAVAYAEEAMALADKQKLPHAESAAAPLAMGRICSLLHRDADAVPYLERARDEMLQYYGDAAPETVQALRWLAEAYYAAAEYEKSVAAYRAALDAADACFVPAETKNALQSGLADAQAAVDRGASDIPPSY